MAARSRRSDGDLHVWNRRNVLSLIAKLRALRIDGKIRFKDVILASNLHEMRKSKASTVSDRLALAQQRLARLANSAGKDENWRNLREEEYRALLNYLSSRPDLWSQAEGQHNIEMMFPDPMFYATAHWLGMRDASFEDVRSNFPGVYTIFRHSLLKPRHVLIGRLEIVHDKRTGAVRTIEKYHVEDSPLTPARDFELTGYLFRRNSCHRIISKETGSDELQYMFINMVDAQGGKHHSRTVTKMSGILSDIQGHFFYSTRFCCLRKEPAKIGAVPAGGIPADVMLDINNKPKLEAGGYISKF